VPLTCGEEWHRRLAGDAIYSFEIGPAFVGERGSDVKRRSRRGSKAFFDAVRGFVICVAYAVVALSFEASEQAPDDRVRNEGAGGYAT